MGPDPRDELVESDRLREEVVRAGLEGAEHGVIVARAGDQQDRQRRGLRVAPQGGDDFGPRCPGHPHVEHDAIDRLGLEQGERLVAAARLPGLEAGAMQGEHHHLAEVGIVVDDQDDRVVIEPSFRHR